MGTMNTCRPKRTVTGYISLVVGWFHLIFSTVLSMGLFVYMCFYYHKPNDNAQIAAFGLPVLIVLFLFSFASLVFDVLLITGILARQVKLISIFVYGNYLVLGFIGCSAVYFFIEDYLYRVTKAGLLINPIMHGLTLGTLIYLFYPIYLLIQQTRNPPIDPRRFSDSEGVEKPTNANGDATLVN